MTVFGLHLGEKRLWPHVEKMDSGVPFDGLLFSFHQWKTEGKIQRLKRFEARGSLIPILLYFGSGRVGENY